MSYMWGKKLTMGVNHRIMDLADRENGFVRKNARPFESIVPLPEVISACVRKGCNHQTVNSVNMKRCFQETWEMNLIF